MSERGGAKAKKALPPLVEEYSEAWLAWKVREELGYDQHDPYEDEADAVALSRLNELEREEKIAERVEKAKAAEFKYKVERDKHLAR